MNFDIKEIGGGIIFSADSFDVGQTLECGQCFRFARTGEHEYKLTAFGRVLNIAQDGGETTLSPTNPREFNEIWLNYFDLATDYSSIKRTLTDGDPVMRSAVEYSPGIRLLNQEPWECLISFIISQNNNIPRIKKIIERLSAEYGDDITDGARSFPSPERLAGAGAEGIKSCGAGFRAKYVSGAAEAVWSGTLDLYTLAGLPSDELIVRLMELKGVGRKVANCAALFSFGRRELFPVDVWVKRVMERFYFGGNDTPVTEIESFARKRFGEYGGYAQQYLFNYARGNKLI